MKYSNYLIQIFAVKENKYFQLIQFRPPPSPILQGTAGNHYLLGMRNRGYDAYLNFYACFGRKISVAAMQAQSVQGLKTQLFTRKANVRHDHFNFTTNKIFLFSHHDVYL